MLLICLGVLPSTGSAQAVPLGAQVGVRSDAGAGITAEKIISAGMALDPEGFYERVGILSGSAELARLLSGDAATDSTVIQLMAAGSTTEHANQFVSSVRGKFIYVSGNDWQSAQVVVSDRPWVSPQSFDCWQAFVAFAAYFGGEALSCFAFTGPAGVVCAAIFAFINQGLIDFNAACK
jgi:hypothetical protein